MKTILKRLLIVFSILIAFNQSFSQARASEYLKLSGIIEEYNDKDYQEVVRLSEIFIKRNPNYSGVELIVLYQMMITSYIEEHELLKIKNGKVDYSGLETASPSQIRSQENLNNRLKNIINKILVELNRKKLPDTWLSKRLKYNKEGSKWDDFRLENLDIYQKVRDEINKPLSRSTTSTTNTKKSTTIASYFGGRSYEKENSQGISTSSSTSTSASTSSEYRILQNEYIIPTVKDSIKFKLHKNLEGLYVFKEEDLLEYKSNLLINSFKAHSFTPEIEYYLIFESDGELFVFESNTITNTTISSSFTSFLEYYKDLWELEKLHHIEDYEKKVYRAFLENKEQNLYKTKTKRSVKIYELNKKWKKTLERSYNIPKDDIETFEEKNFNIYGKSRRRALFNIKTLDQTKNKIEKILDRYRKYITKKGRGPKTLKEVLKNTDLTMDWYSFTPSAFSNDSSYIAIDEYFRERKDFYQIQVDKEGAGYIHNSQLFMGEDSRNFERILFTRKIELDTVYNKLKVSAGDGFSYSDISLEKHENSLDALEYFKHDFLITIKKVSDPDYGYILTSKISSILSEDQSAKENTALNNERYIDEQAEKEDQEIIDSAVEVEATGYGDTKEEATNDAIITAIGKVNPLFIMSNSELKGEVFTQEISRRLDGETIGGVKVIDVTKNEYGQWVVKIKTRVAPTIGLTNVTTINSSQSVTFDIEKLKARENSQNENKFTEISQIKMLLKQLNEFIRKSIDFNLITTDLKKKGKLYEIGVKVSWSLNEHYDNFQKYLSSHLLKIGMSSLEIRQYKEDEIDFYEFGNIYLRSIESKKMLVNFLSGLNFYAYNFSVKIGKKEYYPSTLRYKKSKGARVHLINNTFTSSSVSIGGLVANISNLGLNQKTELDYIYSKRDIKTVYKIIGSNSSAIYDKKGDVYFDKSLDLNYNDFYAYSPSSITEKGDHEITIKLPLDDWSNPDFLNLNKNYSYKKSYDPVQKEPAKKKKTISSNTTNSNANYAKIIGNSIWVRSSPRNGNVIMKLNNNTECKIIGNCCEETIGGKKSLWYKIEYNGKTGWVFGSQLQLINKANNVEKKSSNPTNSGGTGWAVINDSDGWSNVRSSQSKSSSILFKIYDGQRFKVLKNYGKWSYINYDGRQGYVHNSIIKLIPSETKVKSTISRSKVSPYDKLKESSLSDKWISAYKRGAMGKGYLLDNDLYVDAYKISSLFSYPDKKNPEAGWASSTGWLRYSKFSISFWSKGNSNSGYLKWSSYGNNSGGNYPNYLINIKNPDKWSSGAAKFEVPGNYYGTYDDEFNWSIGPANHSVWNFYTITVDANRVKIYVNSIAVAAHQLNFSKLLYLSDGDLRIDGDIDDIIFWKKTLTSTEVRRIQDFSK